MPSGQSLADNMFLFLGLFCLVLSQNNRKKKTEAYYLLYYLPEACECRLSRAIAAEGVRLVGEWGGTLRLRVNSTLYKVALI